MSTQPTPAHLPGSPPAADVTRVNDATPSLTEAAPAAPPPTMLGPYRVVKELGHGGMGAVYAAEDTHLQRHVALKVMAAGLAAQPAAKQRFLREARAMAAVKHDHIATIYHVGEADGTAFLAMELLEGAPLNRWMAKHPKPSVGVVARLGKEVARGLAAAHAKGLVHRDIKPGNIWLEAPKGRVKLLDFGLARLADDNQHITADGTAVGTPAYMAPEQARAQPVDGRTDLWSLGVLLYRLLTGRLPFEAPNTIAMLTALSLDEPPPLLSLAPATPPALADLVTRLLRKDIAQRPATAAGVAEELLAVERAQAAGPLSTPPAPPPPPVPPKRPRRGWIVAGSAALALLSLVCGIVVIIKNRDGTVTTIQAPTGTEEIRVVQPGQPDVVVTPKAEEPAADAWLTRARALPAAEQQRELTAEIARRNRGFTAVPEYKVRDGKVVGFKLAGNKALGDLAPVAALTALESFTCTMPASPADKGAWADLSPLKAAPLTSLECWNSAVADLAPLRGKPLKKVDIGTTRVSDLTPLAGCPIEDVALHESRVVTLEPLRGMPLRRIDCMATGVTDLTPVAAAPLETLLCPLSLAVQHAALLKAVPTLTRVNSQTATQFARFVALPALAPVAVLGGHAKDVRRVAFNADGTLLASGGFDGALLIWDVAARRVRHRLTPGAKEVQGVAWLDGTRVAVTTAGGDGVVAVFDAATGKPVGTPVAANPGFGALAVSPDRKLALVGLLSNDEGGPVRRYELPSLAPLPPWLGHTATAYQIAFRPDGRRAVTASGDSVRVWDVAGGREVHNFTQRGTTTCLATYTADGRLLIGTEDRDLRVYSDTHTLQKIVSLPGRLWAAASASGNRLIVAGNGDDAYVLDAATLEPQRRLPGHGGKAWDVAVSPDGTTAAVGCVDGRILLWNIDAAPVAAAAPPVDTWLARVRLLPAAEQQREVTAEIARRNRGFTAVPEYEVRDGKVVGFKLAGDKALADLAPVAALTALESFTCAMPNAAADKGAWADLSPLRDAPLHTLDIRGCRVSDLGVLRDRPLKAVALHSPLRDAPLHTLDIRGCRVSDLGVLRDRPLKAVALHGTAVTDLSPLAGCPLVKLHVRNTGVSSLEPLRNAPLADLDCLKSKVTDLTPLAATPLQTLQCPPELVARHAALLAGMPTLKTVNGEPRP